MQADMLTEQGNLDEVESLYDNALDSFKQALEIYTQIEHLGRVSQLLTIKLELSIGGKQISIWLYRKSRKLLSTP